MSKFVQTHLQFVKVIVRFKHFSNLKNFVKGKSISKNFQVFLKIKMFKKVFFFEDQIFKTTFEVFLTSNFQSLTHFLCSVVMCLVWGGIMFLYFYLLFIYFFFFWGGGGVNM